MAAGELLASVRTAIRQLDAAAEGDSNDEEIQAGHDVASEFGVLDTHLSDGGDLPGPWDRPAARRPSPRALAAAIETAGLGSGTQAQAMAEAIAAQLATGQPGPQPPAARTYEGHVVFADGTKLSLQCHEGRHGECPDTTPAGQEYGSTGPFGGHFCECPGCPDHAVHQAASTRPVATHFYSALLTRFPADAEMPHSAMYVLDLFGLSIIARRRADSSYVHIDTQELSEPPRMPLEVEVNNGGEATYGESASS
jgi:hypothetical protein